MELMASCCLAPSLHRFWHKPRVFSTSPSLSAGKELSGLRESHSPRGVGFPTEQRRLAQSPQGMAKSPAISSPTQKGCSFCSPFGSEEGATVPDQSSERSKKNRPSKQKRQRLQATTAATQQSTTTCFVCGLAFPNGFLRAHQSPQLGHDCCCNWCLSTHPYIGLMESLTPPSDAPSPSSPLSSRPSPISESEQPKEVASTCSALPCRTKGKDGTRVSLF